MHKTIVNNVIKFTFLIFLFSSIKTIAQENDKPSKYFPSIAPPPPNSASLGLYGQVPLNQFTGTANISIPLLEIKSSSLSLPISLSYSSDGVKVDQYESNVGMGWALNTGGVVTRQVFDYADNYNGRLQKPNTAIDSDEMTLFLDQASVADQVDTQPDIFTYNINGMSGKFFLDNTNKPIEIEPSGLKIEVTSNFLDMGFDPNSAPEIIITDTKGIKYYFGGLNAIEATSSRRIFIAGVNPPSDYVKTSWYLTKIEDPSTNNQITLSYDSRIITYITGNEQSLEYTFASNTVYTAGLYDYMYNSRSTESLLKEINTTNSKVSFTYSKRFTDPDFPLSKVDEISYSTIQGTLIKKIKFDYDEYSGSTFPNNYNQSFSYFKKRFFLKQINEFSTNTNPITHKFEYYSPENLPGRFSFTQDNYGVFNGKINNSLISDEISVLNSVINRAFADGKLANRRPDKNFGYFGLLKKIIYPTKGSTTLEYEPHVLGKINLPIYPAKNSFKLNVQTVAELLKNTNTATIHSSIEQTVKINSNVVNNCPDENPFPLRSVIEITDLSTNTLVKFWTIASNSDIPILIGTSYTIYGNPSPSQDIFTLEANKDYSVTIKLERPCMFSNIYFDYYANPVTYQEIEKEIGGFRILRITKDNAINGTLEKEKYYYSPINCLSCQSGSYINQAPLAHFREIERVNKCEVPAQRTLYSIGSSNLTRIYSSQNAQFGYEYVTKSYGNNFENGGEEARYEIVQDGIPITVQGEQDTTTPFTNAFGSGRLVSHKIFNNALKIVKETYNQYQHDITKDQSVKGYNAYNSIQAYSFLGGIGINPPNCEFLVAWYNYSLSEYSVRSQWNYLKQSIETQYDINGSNPITITNDYTYNNPNHLQMSSQKKSTSITGETFETKYFYPSDPEMANEPFKNELISKNMIGIPLDTQSFKGAEKLSEQKTEYANDTGNLLLQKYVYAKKGADLNSTLEKKITYNKYDDNGTLLQYTPENGTPVTIIWGYNKTQPIAKIENAAYNDVSSYVANLQTISDNGTESNLIQALGSLRTSLPNAMVTTYTYKPLIGVSSITDPKENTTYYEYDEFNRLKLVKDAQGKILSENQYHYKN